MTADEFKAIQAELGYTRQQMADAMHMSTRSIDDARGGRRPIPLRTALIAQMLVDWHRNVKRIRDLAVELKRPSLLEVFHVEVETEGEGND